MSSIEHELECSEGESCQDRALIRKQAEEITQLRQQRSAMEQELSARKHYAMSADRLREVLQQATREAFEAGFTDGISAVDKFGDVTETADEAWARHQQPSSPRPEETPS